MFGTVSGGSAWPFAPVFAGVGGEVAGVWCRGRTVPGVERTVAGLLAVARAVPVMPADPSPGAWLQARVRQVVSVWADAGFAPRTLGVRACGETAAALGFVPAAGPFVSCDGVQLVWLPDHAVPVAEFELLVGVDVSWPREVSGPASVPVRGFCPAEMVSMAVLETWWTLRCDGLDSAQARAAAELLG